MTKDDVDELERLFNAATPGTWRWEDGDEDSEDEASLESDKGTVCDFGNYTQYYPTAGTPPNDGDRAFITEVHNRFPEILSALRRAAGIKL